LDELSATDMITDVSSDQKLINLNLRDLWVYRELLYFLVWRDIKIRYKQTYLGAAWAVIQPVFTMIIFSIVFGQLAKLPSDGIPYPVFTYTALLPWQLFAYALSSASNSLVSNQQLITKVYFPRLVIPIASVLSGLVDFAIAFLVLIAMMLYYHIQITTRLFTLPLFILLAVATALAVGLWLSALNVKYRDVRYTVPFLTQFWMYATPIAYSSNLFPQPWRSLLGLNPMTGVVEGFRWAMLGTSMNINFQIVISTVIVIFLIITGLVYFKKTEASFADVI
jgi:lipopolysaccharide transport system permease protein